MIKIAIVEDENQAADMLENYIHKFCESRNIKANIVKFDDAAILLKNYKPVFDIIFMDILLPNLSGMDASKQLRELDKSVILIFVTNMANFAVKGYEVDALDFIIKPVVYDSFSMKMNKAISKINNRIGKEIKVQIDGTTKLIPAYKIYYAEVSRHYLIYHTEEGNYVTRGTISELEKYLASENFTRCNVCYLVNLKFIDELKGDSLVIAGDTLHISRARKKEFLETLTNYLGGGI